MRDRTTESVLLEADYLIAALDSSRLRSIVSASRQAHGPRKARWSLRERLAWHELVVVRGMAA